MTTRENSTNGKPFEDAGKEKAPHEAQNGMQEESSSEDKALDELPREELIKKVHELQASAERHFDLYLRAQAEMENLKKRFQKEKEEYLKFGNEALIKELLPVVDNLEKAIGYARDAETQPGQENKALLEGLQLTLKVLVDVLERAGVERVEALGQPFDPHVHEAVSVSHEASAEPGTVLQELQSGYRLKERLIRPSLVVVNQKES